VTIWLVDQIVFVLSGSKSGFGDLCVSVLYVLSPEYSVAILLRPVQFQVIPCHRFRIIVPCLKVFDKNATGCLSPLISVWVRTAPDVYFNALDSIWKGLE
jgi:hypothetical protein